MCPHCGAALERLPTDTPGCSAIFCAEDCGYAALQITTEGLEEGDPASDSHPLVDGLRAGFGDEEVATCDACGRLFLAEEASSSIWNGRPICPRCEGIQQAEQS